LSGWRSSAGPAIIIFEILRNDETLHFEVVLFEIDFSLVLIESARESLGEFAPYFIRADA
jgi:hypothetical protein